MNAGFSTYSTAHEKNYLNIDVTEDRRSAGYSRTRTSFPCFICSQMAPCEFLSDREAEGQWDVVPVGLFNSVRTECRSQAGLLGSRVSSRLQLAQTQSCRQRGATGSQPRSTAITVEHAEEPQTEVWRGLLRNLNAMVFRVTFLEMCRRAWQRGEKNGTRMNLLPVTFSAGRSDFSVACSRARTRADSSYESLPRAARWIPRTEAREPRFLFPHMHKTSSLVRIEQQHPKCCCHGSQACLNPGHSSNIFFLVGAELRRLDSMKTKYSLKIFET